MTYAHHVRVRYGECDMQKVVFNANYWVYCDDAVDHWVRRALAEVSGIVEGVFDITSIGFDFMLKKAVGTWHKAVVFGEEAVLLCSVKRWGRTSFDVAIDMRVGGETRFDADITYVSVGVVSREAVPIPDVVKDALQLDLSGSHRSPRP